MAQDNKPFRAQKAPPAPNVDFYELAETLDPEDRAVVGQVREFMETKVAPVINKYWVDDAFPFDLLPRFKELGIGGIGLNGYGCFGGTPAALRLRDDGDGAHDRSMATFFGVHDGLAMGSIYLDGSEEQKQTWLPPMARLEKIGCFGLTEPLVGSGAGGGLTTTAKREGDTWILERPEEVDRQFALVRRLDHLGARRRRQPGQGLHRREQDDARLQRREDRPNKIALKVVQNGLITLKDCRVPEANRLQSANSFRDTARVLRMTRYAVAWISTGCQMGAYEHALAYAKERKQFGKPIAAFQMMQDLLAKMLGNVTACQCLMLRLSADGRRGQARWTHTPRSPRRSARRGSRETVAWAREMLGANGIVVDYDVARFFADAEALYSYEGTFQMQNLIVGKAVTGFSAFV